MTPCFPILILDCYLYHFLICIDKCKCYNEIQSVHHDIERNEKNGQIQKINIIKERKAIE